MSASSDDPVCWICYERAFGAEAGAHSAGPLLRACACRGPDASFSHLPCLVKYAGANDTASRGKSWWQCPTCKQDYTGELQLGLARARWELVRNRAGVEDGERRTAANDLAMALQHAGDFEDALPLFEDALAMARCTNGDDHPDTLSCINNVAALHNYMGNHHLALPQCRCIPRRCKEGGASAATITLTRLPPSATSRICTVIWATTTWPCRCTKRR
jgi:hypothetical protein